MGHPTEGVLRRLLDEPDGVATTDRRHVETCQQCASRVAAIRQDADLVHAALATGAGTEADVAGAWRRMSAAASSPDTTWAPPAAPLRMGRLRAALRRPVVATVAVAMVVTGAGAAAANDWFQIFRTEKIAPVSLSTADLNALPDLRDYGDVALTARPEVHPVPDASAAEAETGLEVPRVTSLPRGVTGEPSYQAGGEANVTFTFSAARAARAAAAAGKPLPPPPPGLDGSQVRLVAGPGVAAVWVKSGVPVLVVGRAVAPRAFSSSGVPFETMRDYLLSFPGLPASVAAPLRTFNASGSALPLPVPADRVTTSAAQVDGEPATVLATRDRSLAAVMWVKDGVVTVVAGTLDTDEVVSVARSLR
ncbi:MAG: hypothetical protein ACLGI2_18015 [Acidimicrobiia bacterium]